MEEILSEAVDIRPFEPDFPRARNPWDAKRHPKQYAYIQSIIKQVDADVSRPPKYSDEIKLEVYRLRDAGLTLRQIAETTKISKSTACLYLQKRPSAQTIVTRPGTRDQVEVSYTLSEVNLGKIAPFKTEAPKS